MNPLTSSTNPTSTDPQYILTRTPKNEYEVYQFCNQYDDKVLVYRYDQRTNSFSVNELSLAYMHELSTSGSTKITRDQWNKFITAMRLLSATVLAAIPEDKATKYGILYMETHQPSNHIKFYPTYKIAILRQIGIVTIAEDLHISYSKASEVLLIPFNQTLKDRILKYQQELRNSVQNILGII